MDLDDILRGRFGAEIWIRQGWHALDEADRLQIKRRMDALFDKGLPFTLKHDKILYIYAFSLLAQLEVLAIQIPLNFKDTLSSLSLRQCLHQQLLDEIFHGLVFVKILYLLVEPHATPPEYSSEIEGLCNFIREETCPKTAMVLLNLVGEGWIEEIFDSLLEQHIAPEIFKTVLNDEHRHVSEAELYREIGLPDPLHLASKIAYLEEQLLRHVFMQYKYVYSVNTLLGVDAAIRFLQNLDTKHQNQLKKLGMSPSHSWQKFMRFAANLVPKVQRYAQENTALDMTPIRETFLTQWDDPLCPTMVGEFDLDISSLGFFEKKIPSETITMLMLQTLSRVMHHHSDYRQYLNHGKLYRSELSYVGLVVLLPGTGDHLGTIVFENAHNMRLRDLARRVQHVIKLMTYCFQKREAMEVKNPKCRLWRKQAIQDYRNDIYGYPMPGSAVVSLSNIGQAGFQRAKSPLRRNESMKFTLMAVERKPKWDSISQSFQPADMLPVSISADHRIFNGAVPVKAHFSEAFMQQWQLELTKSERVSPQKTMNWSDLELAFAELEHDMPEMLYPLLSVLQTYWLDFLEVEQLLALFAKPLNTKDLTNLVYQ